MVKFFLKNQKNLPKQQLKQLQQQRKSQKSAVTDFRLVVYKKLSNLIKAQHAIMVQKLIRKIKQKKVDGEEKHKQEIQKLDNQFNQMKHIKKPALKEITLYLMSEVLKIANLKKVAEKQKNLEVDEVDMPKLKERIQKSATIRHFIEKLSSISTYKKELEECDALVNVVNHKKSTRKQKLKERKARKKERKAEEKQDSQAGQASSANQQVEEEPQNREIDLIVEQPKKKKEPKIKKDKANSAQNKISEQTDAQPKKKVNDFFQRQNDKKQQQSQSNAVVPKERKQKAYGKMSKKDRLQKDIEKSRPINKQRSEFKKTGRNKVLFQKKQQKQRFKQQPKPTQQGENQSQKLYDPPMTSNKPYNKASYPSSKQNSSERPHVTNTTSSTNATPPFSGFSYSHPRQDTPKKLYGHPSWVAKQEQKAQVYIKPFEGKKILL